MSEGKTPRNPPRRRMPRPLDEALAEWPAPARSAFDWDEQAERVLARIAAGETPRSLARVSDEDLFASPVPFSPDEVQDSAAPETPRGVQSEGAMSTASREKDRASLKDLAKLATSASLGAPAPGSGTPSGTQPVAAEREENSGVVHLAALAAESGEAMGREQAPASAPVSAPPDSGPPSAPPSSIPSVAPAVPAPAAAAVANVASPTPRGRGKTSRWVAASGLLAAAAVAAGVFVGMQRAPSAPAAVAVGVGPTSAPVAPPAAEPAAPKAPSPSRIAPDDRGVDPSTLPTAQNASAVRPSASPPAAVAVNGAHPAPANPSPAALAPPPAAVAAAAAAPADTSTLAGATGTDKGLQTLMQQAASVTSSPTAAAAGTPSADAPLAAPGSVPLRPSFGAVQGAIGAALPGARACLGPDDPISRAMVTFKSDGSVESVGVTGGAAGRPAEACIRAALMKARVAPFAQPTFSAPATVRPN